MRVVLAHSCESDIQELRRHLHSAGLECNSEDCVEWNALATRLVRRDGQMLVLKLDHVDTVDWYQLREATSLITIPIVAVGPADDVALVTRARDLGAVHFLDRSQVRDELDSVLGNLRSANAIPNRLGSIVSVFGPTPGSGVSTVALNLAGTLSTNHPREVGLIELSPEGGDLALLLDVDPKHSVKDICERTATLDSMSLRNSFTDHESGFSLLINGAELDINEHLNVDSVRRICVLTRVEFSFTVVAMDSHVTDENLEIMRLSDVILLVVRPDVPAVRRAARALEMAGLRGIPRERFRPLINRSGQKGQLKVGQIESSLELGDCHLIPDDPGRVNTAANQGVLLQELSQSAVINRRFSELAASLHENSIRKTRKRWSVLTGRGDGVRDR